jgi:hypothetical protein
MVLVLVTGAISPMTAFAQDDEGDDDAEGRQPSSGVAFTVRGDGQGDGERIVVRIEPGQGSDILVFVGNLGEAPLSLFSFTADIGTKLNGGLELAAEGSEQHEPTTWIDFPTYYFEVEPQTEVGREARIQVPDGAEPGEYVIPIAVETVDSYAVPGAPNLLQKVRKVLAVYVVVPGEVQPGFELGEPRIEFRNQRPAVLVPLTNTGRTSLRISGQMVLKDQSGVTVLDTGILMGTVYSLHETSVFQQLPAALPPGEYRLTLQLTDAVSEFSANLDDVPVTMPEPESNEVVPLAFGQVLIVPNADPIQFVAVGAEIVNNDQPIRLARLVLIVEKDGELLEEFTIAENLTIDRGVTTVAQRYLPLTGWEPGTYTFSLRLETVDSSSGAASVLLTGEDVATIEVPG